MKYQKYFWAGAAGFLLFLCIFYWESFAGLLALVLNAASPLLVGCVIAYAVNILMSFYERHYFPKSSRPIARKSARPVCMLASVLTMVAILVAVSRLVIPELKNCIGLMLNAVPGILEKLTELLSDKNILTEELLEPLKDVDWRTVLQKVAQALFQGLGSAAAILSELFSSVVNLLLGFIFAIYLLTGKERLRAQCQRLMRNYLRPAWAQNILHGLTVADGCFHKFLVGQCTEAVILGVLCALGMALLGFPYATMVGAVIGVTALIPVAGAYIGGAVGFILILTEDPVKALLFIVYLVVLQQLEGNLIYPRVVGTSIGLPGIWVLAAVTIGGGVGGIAGMLLGVPLAATTYQLLRENMNRRERQRTETPTC